MQLLARLLPLRVLIAVIVAFVLLFVMAPMMAAAQILSIPAPSCTAVTTVTCKGVQVTLPASSSGGTTTPPACTSLQVLVNGVCTTPVVTPPAAGTSWVFHNGLVWLNHDMSYGDYNYNYTDTTGKPEAGSLDIAATGTQGGWQPGSPNLDWDTTGYNSFVISIKPGVAGMAFIMGAESSASGGDTVIQGGANPNLGSFCDKPLAVGQWSHCTIPLHAGGFNLPVGQHLRKIMLQPQNPSGKKSYFIAEAGFIP
jgi:hypothetical protein